MVSLHRALILLPGIAISVKSPTIRQVVPRRFFTNGGSLVDKTPSCRQRGYSFVGESGTPCQNAVVFPTFMQQ